MTHLDIFSGIGGMKLAAEWNGYTTTQFVERDPYCKAVLRKHWPDIPIHDHAETYKHDGVTDLVTAGVPCAPVSHCGNMQGDSDSRWMWDHAVRIIGEARPRYAIMENPTGLLYVHGGREFGRILSDLHSIGFCVWWETVGSHAVGAPHLRKRLWIVAANTQRSERRQESHRREVGRVGRHDESLPWNEPWASALCRLRGVDDGSGYTSHRVDTIRNSVTPQLVSLLIRSLHSDPGE